VATQKKQLKKKLASNFYSTEKAGLVPAFLLSVITPKSKFFCSGSLYG